MRNKELLHRFENISDHLSKINNRLDKLEEDDIRRKYYNNLSNHELKELYNISDLIEKIHPPKMIDSVKFTVFDTSNVIYGSRHQQIKKFREPKEPEDDQAKK